jgi:hypothetical protein
MSVPELSTGDRVRLPPHFLASLGAAADPLLTSLAGTVVSIRGSREGIFATIQWDAESEGRQSFELRALSRSTKRARPAPKKRRRPVPRLRLIRGGLL